VTGRPTDLRPVADDQWPIVAWLWQAFRHDLAPVVKAFPYADGRYNHEWLEAYPGPGRVGYLAWAPHPNTGEDAPIAFALLKGLDEPRTEFASFFVVPVARRGGLGRRFALEVIGQHPGAWEIGFQHDNVPAARFWRAVAEDAWGDGWLETEEPVPDKPDVPPDHWIRTR
jgi:predicted acetyltransferase